MAFNKLLNAVKHSIDKAYMINISGIVRWTDKWYAENGMIKQDFGKSVAIKSSTIFKDGLDSTPWLTFIEAKQIATKIDKLNVGSDHLSVKYNVTWREAYQFKKREIEFMDNLGAISGVDQETIPCHNCGIILPIDCIQVDHHMPQTGGEDLYTIKMLRAMGMTIQGPSGSKGSEIIAGNKINAIDILPKARDRGDYNHLYNTSAANKWTTNNKGTAFLSLLATGNCLNDLTKICKNSLLNLVPLCGECNRIKSDWVKPIG